MNITYYTIFNVRKNNFKRRSPTLDLKDAPIEYAMKLFDSMKETHEYLVMHQITEDESGMRRISNTWIYKDGETA